MFFMIIPCITLKVRQVLCHSCCINVAVRGERFILLLVIFPGSMKNTKNIEIIKKVRYLMFLKQSATLWTPGKLA